ncbi:MAG: MIP/aquaporin family protein [Acidimicrobiales bacterium]
MTNSKKLIVEAIGAFFLVFTVGMVVASETPFGGLAVGAVLMVMIFAGGHISGGHYNPAVSTAVWLRGKLTTADWVAYVIAQLVGGVLAGLVVIAVNDVPAIGPTELAWEPLVAEFLFTFALAYVVLNVATSKGTEGNSFYGLAIGFTVLAGAFAVGGLSGGAFNPAVTVGAWVMDALDIGATWAYLLVQIGAGAAAAVVFRAVAPTGDIEEVPSRVVAGEAAPAT